MEKSHKGTTSKLWERVATGAEKDAGGNQESVAALPEPTQKEKKVPKPKPLKNDESDAAKEAAKEAKKKWTVASTR